LLDCLSYLIAEMLVYRATGLDYRTDCATIIHRLSTSRCDRSIELPRENISRALFGDIGLRTQDRHALLLDADGPAAGLVCIAARLDLFFGCAIFCKTTNFNYCG